nr:ATP synthase F0 subunit 8 [Ceresium sinicum ornaticolle]
MPQMAPMNWLMLLFYFTLIFILFNTVNYYSFLYQIKFSSKKIKKSSFNWKW